MLLSILLIAFVGGIVASFTSSNRRLPSIILLLGFVLILFYSTGITTYSFALAGIAILSAIIWKTSETTLKHERRNTLIKAICCAVSGFTMLGFCMTFFLSAPEQYPLVIPHEGDVEGKSRYYDWQFWTSLNQMGRIISPFIGIALLVVALRLGNRLRRKTVV